MEEAIRGVLAEHGQLHVDARTMSREADLYEGGMSSHASINVMLGLEEVFDVEFPDSLLRRGTFESVEAIAGALVQLGCVPADQ